MVVRFDSNFRRYVDDKKKTPKKLVELSLRAENEKGCEKAHSLSGRKPNFILLFPIPALSDLWLAALTQPVPDYLE